MKTTVTTVIELPEIPIALRYDLQIAAECIINQKCFNEEPWSSRVLADEIVDMVLDSLSGKRKMPIRENLKPWEPFGFKFEQEKL